MSACRATEIAHSQQDLLIARSRDEGMHGCVFDDMQNAVDPIALQMMDALSPGPDLGKDEARVAYAAMEEYIMEESHWAILPDRTSFCLAHNQRCPLHVGFVLRTSCPDSPLPRAETSNPWWQA